MSRTRRNPTAALIVLLGLAALNCRTLTTGSTPRAPGTDASVAPGTPVSTSVPLEFPVDFPMAPLTSAQKDEVADCDVEGLAASRYPEQVAPRDLQDEFEPVSACDWAILSFAHASRSESDWAPSAGVVAFKEAIRRNYGFALSTPLFYHYFGEAQMVHRPELDSQEITTLAITYDWSGLGEPSSVGYRLVITEADAEPVIQPEPPLALTSTIKRETIQELSQALGDLLPVDRRFELVPCTDNYLSWTVMMTFADGTKLKMATASNFLGFGGPWHTEIDDQVYLQYGADFATAFYEVVEELGAPLGEPFAMTCFGDRVFDKAFPRWHEVQPPTPTPDSSYEDMMTALHETMEAEAPGTPTP